MELLQIVLQVVIALGIANVWLLRREKATPFRGGKAQTMEEEFAAYGLSKSAMLAIGALKLSLAAALLVGIAFPILRAPAAGAMALLMLGAVGMHIKVKDPVMRALPAAAMLLMSLGVVMLSTLAS